MDPPLHHVDLLDPSKFPEGLNHGGHDDSCDHEWDKKESKILKQMDTIKEQRTIYKDIEKNMSHSKYNSIINNKSNKTIKGKTQAGIRGSCYDNGFGKARCAQTWVWAWVWFWVWMCFLSPSNTNGRNKQNPNNKTIQTARNGLRWSSTQIPTWVFLPLSWVIVWVEMCLFVQGSVMSCLLFTWVWFSVLLSSFCVLSVVSLLVFTRLLSFLSCHKTTSFTHM